jgi:hypothetical protein
VCVNQFTVFHKFSTSIMSLEDTNTILFNFLVSINILDASTCDVKTAAISTVRVSNDT